MIPTVLIVEDDETWGKILSRYLAARGCEVTWHRDTSAAIQFILEVDPDLIMLDLKLPDDGGPILIESIERLGPEIVSKTVVLTGYPNVVKTWASQVKVISKSDLSDLGNWIDHTLKPKDGSGIERDVQRRSQST